MKLYDFMGWKATHRLKMTDGESFLVMQFGKFVYLAHQWAESAAGDYEIDEENNLMKYGTKVDAEVESVNEEESEDWK